MQNLSLWGEMQPSYCEGESILPVLMRCCRTSIAVPAAAWPGVAGCTLRTFSAVKGPSEAGGLAATAAAAEPTSPVDFATASVAADSVTACESALLTLWLTLAESGAPFAPGVGPALLLPLRLACCEVAD